MTSIASPTMTSRTNLVTALSWRYALAGALFGLLFPLGALTFDCLRQGLPWSWGSIVAAHHTNPLHWVIDTAPFFLGLCALVAATSFKHLHADRQQVEAALRQNEVRFQRMVANLPEGMIYQFLLRPDGSVAFPYISPSCRGIYGLEPEEIQGNPALIMDAVHSDDQPAFHQSIVVSAQTLSPWRWEGRAIVNGALKWFQGASRPERLANGDILWDGLLMDVTAHKRAEAALQESESAGGGAQGLEMLRAAAARGQLYDIALLDYQMPEMDGLELVRAIKADPTLTALKLVMLASVGHKDEAKQAREAGVDAYMTKPARQSQLYDCLATVLGQSLRKEEPPHTTLPPAPGAATTQHRPLILVAEDNAVNQKLAVRMLEKLGYRADVVANGREALEALACIPYAAILMDCHMPEMDGVEATVEIRVREKLTGTHIPIIAMTANAMQGDREQCLTAGMDNYLSKPVSPQELKTVLTQWLRPADTPVPTPPSSPASTLTLAFNFEEALTRMEGDRQLLGEIATLFLDSCPKLLTKLQDALSHRDAKALEHAAHALKGSAGNFGATAVFDAARSLEKMGRHGDLAQAPAVLGTLEHELARLQSSLSALNTEVTA